MRRHEQQLHATLQKSVKVFVNGEMLKVTLGITWDDEDPYATLSACDSAGAQLAEVREAVSFKLTVQNAQDWANNAFRRRAETMVNRKTPPHSSAAVNRATLRRRLLQRHDPT